MQSLEIFSTPWFLVFCAVLFASFIRGLAGFGLALILAPILLLIFNPASMVVINSLLALLSNILILLRYFAKVNFKRIIPMALSSLLGIPIGVWVITVIDPHILKMSIGIIIIGFAIPIAIGYHKSFADEKLASSIAGLLSGILSTSTSLGGPPIVILMHGQYWPKDVIHPSLSAYFMFLCCGSIGALSLAGQVSMEMIKTAASLTPAMLLGVYLGMIIFNRVNALFFRGISMCIVICTGLLGIISGLGIFP
ncbi:sulfite exporter TauE/SafE family protein [Chloroflexota bacterium]